MELYIKLLNGKPVDHPITKENMESAYSHVDLDNLPVDWAKFVRVPRPQLGTYDVAEVYYEWVGDVVMDVWYTHTMGEEEKQQKQARVKKSWIEDGGFSNWVFNEETCSHVPPVSMPQDGKLYIWVQEATKWVEIDPPESPWTNRPPYPVTDPSDTRAFLWNETTNSWDLMDPQP
jgi:hypothetical protein